MTKQELKEKIKLLKDELDPLEKQLRDIYANEGVETDNRISAALMGGGNFKDEELRYAAFTRCNCGAGMAYPKQIGIQGSWYCSNILKGVADRTVMHSSPLPFSFYEVKSEDQPSVKGATTRPQ